MSGKHDIELVRLGPRFRLVSEVEQDTYTEPKATTPVTCLPKVRLLEPEVVHCTRRDNKGLCL